MSWEHLPSDDAVPLASLGLDGFETGVLAVVRHFLNSFTRPETQGWRSAYAIAVERWGEAKGLPVAQGALGLLDAVRQARRASFRFANPLCVTCRGLVTGEEAALMEMLHAMRRDRADLARPAAARLGEGRLDPALLVVALAFAARHPAAPGDAVAFAAGPDQQVPAGRGHLRLVH